MKLRKQPGAKLALVASSFALLGALFALVRSQPQLGEAAPEPSAAPAGNYKDFFFPTGPSASPAPATTQPLEPAPRPHTRTRAS